jgi:hypothetical protein
MARRKKPNIWQQFALECFKPSYNRDAGRVLYGGHDVEHWFVVPGQDADGNLISLGYESEPVVHPILKKWIDALMAFDDREHHDAAPLIAMLESNVEMLPIVGVWLGDLVRRHNISCGIEDFIAQRRQLACVLRDFVWSKPKAGRPKVAAYDMSDRDAELHIDNEKVTDHLKTHGGTVDDAIAAIVRNKFPRDPEAQSRRAIALKNFREGRHTSARRTAKRRS